MTAVTCERKTKYAEKLEPCAKALHTWVLPEGSKIECGELVIVFYAETLRLDPDGQLWIECYGTAEDYNPYYARIDVTRKEALLWLQDCGGICCASELALLQQAGREQL